MFHSNYRQIYTYNYNYLFHPTLPQHISEFCDLGITLFSPITEKELKLKGWYPLVQGHTTLVLSYSKTYF